MAVWESVLYSGAKKNALKREIPFTITRAQFDTLVERSGGRCMVTGIEFQFTKFEGSSRRPFAPSLDRIDSSKGYTPQNCRLVCVLVNLALNEWGLEPLLKVARHLVVREDELREQTHSRKHWRAAGYVTVKDHLTSLNVEFSSADQRHITNRAKALCEYEGIEYTNVWVQVGTARKDGSYREELKPAFPIGILERLIVVESPEEA